MIRALRRLWLRNAVAWHDSKVLEHSHLRDRAREKLEALNRATPCARRIQAPRRRRV